MYSKKKYVEGYRRWLQMMNYVQSSIDYGPVRLNNFLEWMAANEVTEIKQISGSKVKQFFEELSKRKSQTTGEILSIATLRNYLTTINRFARYLRQTEEGNIEVPIKFKGQAKKAIVVLSKEEINRLYQQCDDSLLGIRDRALLAVFYGCGVRRNEAVNIEIKDVLADRNLLYIRKGKGYKERYVPMVGKVRNDIINYIKTARPMMMNKEVHEVFFIGINGKPLGASSLYERFKKLLKRSGIEKKAGLHTLRHSIATHLLINGMKLSEIAKFLGHSSLESTQIYTHLKDEL
jgi:site-specific recombinase XerD